MDRDRRGGRRLTANSLSVTARLRVIGIAAAVAGLGGAAAAAIAGAAVPAAAAPSRASGSAPLTAITAVSCASATHCWAGAADARGSAIIATADGGTTWRVQYTTTRFDDVVAIDCASAASCVAIGYDSDGAGTAFLETTDGGKAWSVHPTPKSLALAQALSCANGSDCWAVGLAGNRSQAAVARTTDGGRDWTSQPIPKLQTAMSSPFGISCTSGSRCLVTGEGDLITVNGGKTWAGHAIPGGPPLGPVTCPSAKDCYAVFNVTSAVPSNEETVLFTSADGGVTWKDVLADPPDVAGLTGISCPSTTICVAVGNGYTPRRNGTDALYGLSELTSTGGRHWARTQVGKAQTLDAGSCAAGTKDCIAGGETSAGAVLLRSTNDGLTWTSEPLPRA
jgi:hypothetical protein